MPPHLASPLFLRQGLSVSLKLRCLARLGGRPKGSTSPVEDCGPGLPHLALSLGTRDGSWVFMSVYLPSPGFESRCPSSLLNLPHLDSYGFSVASSEKFVSSLAFQPPFPSLPGCGSGHSTFVNGLLATAGSGTDGLCFRLLVPRRDQVEALQQVL